MTNSEKYRKDGGSTPNESELSEADRYYQKMTQTPVSRLILRLGIPTTVSMLITNIYNLADTYFVGALGESPQAATGILFTLQCIIQAVRLCWDTAREPSFPRRWQIRM